MPKKTEKRDEELIIQRAWLQGLLSTAQRVVDTLDKIEVSTIAAKSNIYALLGYISSADYILKRSQDKGKKPMSGSELKAHLEETVALGDDVRQMIASRKR